MRFSFCETCVAGNTVVFLDVDDFPIPKHLDPQTIRQKIKRALENRGYLGDVSVRLYGDKNTLPGKYSMDKYADAGIEICLVPPEGEIYIYPFLYIGQSVLIYISVDIYR